VDFELDVGKGRQKARPDGGDDRSTRELGDIEAQPPEGMALLASEVVERARDLLDCRPSPVEQAQTGIGERDAPRRAVQQSHREALLELPHRMTQRRRSDADTRRRRAEAEIVGDGDERGQIGEISAAHC